MAIIRWTPRHYVRSSWRELDRMRGQLEGMFDNLAGAVESRLRGGSGVYPMLNLSEDDNNLYLTAELPGVSAGDLDLSIHQDSLTLKGERTIVEAEENAGYHRREREGGAFRRVITLPTKVDAGAVKASLKNGMLNVVMPKAAEAKPQQVSIQAD